MNTKEISIEEFKKTLTETISSMKGGNNITINYNGDTQIACFSNGQRIFESNNADPLSAFEMQLFLEAQSFNIENYRMSPSYSYDAIYQKPTLPLHKKQHRKRH